MKKIIIIGGGPAGMMAAISTKESNPLAKVKLLERNNELGKKLKLTGGGRCNLTANVSNQQVVEATPKNGKFLFSSLTNFNPKTIINFFEKEGCPLKIEDHKRVFPKSERSIDVINVLHKKLLQLGVIIQYNTYIEKIDWKAKIIKTSQANISYDYLIIATGGISYPKTGSDGSGYSLARSLGHTITELKPAEVPLVSNDKVIQDKILQGLSFQDINLNIYQNNKITKTITHDLIFTHFGISGPAALRASYYVQNILERENTVSITIDFLPNYLNSNLEDSNFSEILTANKIPKKLVQYLKSITNSELEVLEILKKFPLTIYTSRGFSNAFVTNGGISIKEVNPKTMKSKIDQSISFCGEILDINGFTGGFNITAAFSTGYTAGKYVLNEE